MPTTKEEIIKKIKENWYSVEFSNPEANHYPVFKYNKEKNDFVWFQKADKSMKLNWSSTYEVEQLVDSVINKTGVFKQIKIFDNNGKLLTI